MLHILGLHPDVEIQGERSSRPMLLWLPTGRLGYHEIAGLKNFDATKYQRDVEVVCPPFNSLFAVRFAHQGILDTIQYYFSVERKSFPSMCHWF